MSWDTHSVTHGFNGLINFICEAKEVEEGFCKCKLSEAQITNWSEI
jgi:hypothetical protein